VRETAAAGEWVAAVEDQGFSEAVCGVRWAERERRVVHVAVEELWVVAAGGGDGGDVGVD